MDDINLYEELFALQETYDSLFNNELSDELDSLAEEIQAIENMLAHPFPYVKLPVYPLPNVLPTYADYEELPF
jgi:hypothetical protein